MKILLLLISIILLGCGGSDPVGTSNSSSSSSSSRINPFENLVNDFTLLSNGPNGLIMYNIAINENDSIFETAVKNSYSELPYKNNSIVAKLDDTLFVLDTQVSKIYSDSNNFVISKSSIFDSKYIDSANAISIINDNKGYILNNTMKKILEFSPNANSPLYSFDIKFEANDMEKVGANLVLYSNNKIFVFNTGIEKISDSITLSDSICTIVSDGDSSFLAITKNSIQKIEINGMNVKNLSITSTGLNGKAVVDGDDIYFTTGNEDALSLVKFIGSAELNLSIDAGKISNFIITDKYIITIAVDPQYKYVMKIYNKSTLTPAFNKFSVISDKVYKIF